MQLFGLHTPTPAPELEEVSQSPQAAEEKAAVVDDSPLAVAATLWADAMKVADLRAELERRGLDSSGRKPELAARLSKALAAGVTSPPARLPDSDPDSGPDSDPGSLASVADPAAGRAQGDRDGGEDDGGGEELSAEVKARRAGYREAYRVSQVWSTQHIVTERQALDDGFYDPGRLFKRLPPLQKLRQLPVRARAGKHPAWSRMVRA